MAELVDALDSKSSVSNDVGVRVPPPVPKEKSDWNFQSLFFCARLLLSYYRHLGDGLRSLAHYLHPPVILMTPQVEEESRINKHFLYLIWILRCTQDDIRSLEDHFRKLEYLYRWRGGLGRWRGGLGRWRKDHSKGRKVLSKWRNALSK